MVWTGGQTLKRGQISENIMNESIEVQLFKKPKTKAKAKTKIKVTKTKIKQALKKFEFDPNSYYIDIQNKFGIDFMEKFGVSKIEEWLQTNNEATLVAGIRFIVYSQIYKLENPDGEKKGTD